jgi:hypothetical protein
LPSSKTSSFHHQLNTRVYCVGPQLGFYLALYDKNLHQYLFFHLSELKANFVEVPTSEIKTTTLHSPLTALTIIIIPKIKQNTNRN